jgi:hypothetical protein
MLELRAFLALGLATTLTGSAMATSAARASDAGLAMGSLDGAGHVPQLDGPATTLIAPDGRAFAAWAYRASREFDIAVTTRDAGAATWSAPVFFGRTNGADDLQPAITVDANGSAYVAFATGNPSRIELAVLPNGSNVWLAPVTVSGTDAASAPTMMLVGDRLIVAYRTARGVGLVNLPILGGGNQLNGIEDGPDTGLPLGNKNRGNLPANSTPGEPEDPNP